MAEFSLPLPPRDEGWINLRAQLARAARDMHFAAVSKDAANGAALLAIAGNLAQLAMSIPSFAELGTPGRPADASTLFAAQLLQLNRETDWQGPAGDGVI